MGEKTGIAWTERTWNPWTGCTKVSPGCAHCYMYRDKTRYGQNPEVVQRSKTSFTAPLRWKEPALVFTCSWSDWFHESADAWRAEAWDIIRRTPHLTFQILTKRPERVAGHLPSDWGNGYPNVWLGVSIENQRFALRASQLAKIPAVVRFISAEPLLGSVSLSEPLSPPFPECEEVRLIEAFDWVICGGESGINARPMDLDWARSLRDQCAHYGVAFFLKQLGGHPDPLAHTKALLDGRLHTAMPR